MTNNKGNVLIELIMVSILLLLFGVTIFTLIIAGSHTQERIMNNKNAEAGARVAMSYVNVRIRQNDSSYKISVKPNDIDGENAIVIEKNAKDGLYYYDWIYFDQDEKMLKEAVTYEGETLTPDIGFNIAPLESFTVEYSAEQHTIASTATYMHEAAKKTGVSDVKQISSIIALRSQESP